jgi:CheY-like chemotaxis protein
MRVLIVEDEDIISMLTEDMLYGLGHEVAASAGDLAGGLKAAENGGFDVALLDINLRGVTSYPIADLLIERGIPVIFTSGYAAWEVESRYPRIPKVQKPFTAEILEQALSSTLMP